MMFIIKAELFKKRTSILNKLIHTVLDDLTELSTDFQQSISNFIDHAFDDNIEVQTLGHCHLKTNFLANKSFYF